MASTLERIIEAGPLHHALTQGISSLDVDPDDIARQSELVLGLRQRVDSANETLEALRKTTEKERAHFVKRRDSSIRKLGSRLLGKSSQFQEGVGAKERHYSDALAAEVRVRTAKDELDKELRVEEVKHEELLATSSHREQLHSDLDDIYNTVFRGPTPEFPEEDRAEGMVDLADADVVAAQSLLDVVNLSRDLLIQALSKIQLCVVQLQAVPSTALSKGHGMTAFNDDLLHTVTGNKAIHAARGLATQSDSLLQRSKELLPAINVPQPLLISAARINDEQFRWLLSNKPTRDVAEDSIENAQVSVQILHAEMEEIETITTNVREDLSRRSAERTRLRIELRSVRASIFHSVLDGRLTPRTMSPPPSSTYTPPPLSASRTPPPSSARTPSPRPKTPLPKPPPRASYHSSIYSSPKKLPEPPLYSPPPAVHMVLEPLRRRSPSLAGSHLS